ncbi:TraR/DksA family transcriptional regulator [Chloroflexota bacterium]
MKTNFNILRSRLDNEYKRLTGELEQLDSSLRPVSERLEGSIFGKREEEAAESFELGKRLALEEQLRDNLVEVEHALHKFEEGTYGSCDSCGKSIAPARLEALPQASMCVNCKEQQGKNAKGKPSAG